MGLFFNLSVFALFCAAFGHRIRVPSEGVNYQLIKTGAEKDKPLTVTLISVGDRYAVFNISGSDTVGGLPVSQLFINYTTNGPTGQRSKVVSAVKLNGDMHETIKIIDLAPGLHYNMQFFAENSKKELGPPSPMISVLTLPPTPDITVLHPSLNKLKVIWGERMSHSEDYFLLTVEKKSSLGCGVTVNLTSCFGNSYTLDDLQVGQVYKLTMRAHNPSGFSDPVVVSYPIE